MYICIYIIRLCVPLLFFFSLIRLPVTIIGYDTQCVNHGAPVSPTVRDSSNARSAARTLISMYV